MNLICLPLQHFKHQQVQPEEEVQKFTISEGLSEVERIKELLQKKNELQQQYVFINAVNIFRNDEHAQKQIIPMILKSINNYNEKLQTESGNAFSQLLEQNILIKDFYEDLRQTCIQMFRQWSKQVLQAWIEVYAQILKQLKCSLSATEFEKYESESVQFVTKMADKQSPIPVRISSTQFLKALTLNKTFSSQQTFIQKFLQKIKNLCQDVNWEVRLGVCKILSNVSEYIGKENSMKYILPEMLEHIEDEETEVKNQGIIQFVKHLKNVFSSDYINSKDCLKVVHTIFSNFSDPSSGNELKSVIIRKLPKIIECLNNRSDKVLLQLAQDILIQSQNTETNKLNAVKAIKALAQVYSLDNLFFPHFYQPIFSNFIKEEIQRGQQTVQVQIGKYIHYIFTYSFVIPDQDKNLLFKLEVLDLYFQLLKLNDKAVLNELILRADEVFAIFYNFGDVISGQMFDEFKKIRKHYLTQVEKLIQTNWRYHFNFFKFIHKILFISSNNEASTEILPLMMKTLKAPNTTMPVRDYICQILSEGIHHLPNGTFRLSTQQLMVNEISVHSSSQMRIIFLQYLEHLIPKISKQVFKQQYMEPLFKLKDEKVFQILFQYVKIAPLVRMKIDDHRSIDRLESSLKAINKNFSTNKKAKELVIQVEDTLIKLKDGDFLDEVNYNIDYKDKELVQHEAQILQQEKALKSQVARDERLGIERKSGSSQSSQSLGVKDKNNLKSMKSMGSANSLALKQQKSEIKNKLELPGGGKLKEESKQQLMPKKSPMAMGQPLPTKPIQGKKK